MDQPVTETIATLASLVGAPGVIEPAPWSLGVNTLKEVLDQALGRREQPGVQRGARRRT